MSSQIETAFVNGYNANIEIQFQQKGSRLRDTVTMESQNVEFDFYDRIGPTEAVEVTTRHGDTPLVETDHSRRRVATKDFDWGDLIDRKDRLRLLADPTSSYVQNAVMAIGRSLDGVIIDAATGSAWTGKTGSTEVTFPSSSQIAANYVETGVAAASNLTIGKLRRARFLFDSNEAVNDGEELCCIVSASQLQGLLRTTEVTSADYNTVKALVDGKIDTFMGFNFKRTELLNKTGNNRSVLMYPKSGITVGMADDIETRVAERVDKRFSVQVYACGSFGAVRMWEEKVIECLCDESVL